MYKTFLSKKIKSIYNNPYGLILMLLVARWIFVLLIYIKFPLDFTYDEVIVGSVAGQSIVDISNTLLAEPYPLGYILLLKLFPMDDPLFSRLLASVVINVGVILALWYGFKTKIVKKLFLLPGLIIFFSSYTFLISSTYLKAEIFSIPLTLLLFLAIMNILYKNSKDIRDSFIVFIAVTSIFFISYQAYIFAITAVAITYLIKRNMHTAVLLIVHGLVVVVTIVAFIARQYLVSSTRKIWFYFLYNSFFSSFANSIVGVRIFSLLTDVAIALMFMLIFLSTKHKIVKQHVLIYRTTVFLLCLFIAIAYLMHMFTLTRYTYAIFILAFLLAGWGIDTIFDRKQQIILLIAIMLFGFFGFSKEYFSARKVNMKFASTIKKIQQKNKITKVGLVADFSLMPYVVKMQYLRDDKSIIPTSANSDILLTGEKITFDHLNSDYSVISKDRRSFSDVERRLAMYRVNSFIYRLTPIDFHSLAHFDPEKTTLRVLLKNCKYKDFYRDINVGELYTFDDCNFKISEK